MIEYRDIANQLTGQWQEVLAMYGIETGAFHGMNTKNQPCPLCGGTDRAHWRDTQGRISLFCRVCAVDTMKSPENVIMEATGIDFPQLVTELADFVNHVPVEVKQKAKIKHMAAPKINMPVTDKRDHDKSMAFLASCDKSWSFKGLLYLNAQYPYELDSKNNMPIFNVVNEDNITVNLACLSINGDGVNVTFIAGGLSYGAWHEIPACAERNTGKTFYCCDIIEAIKHWYKTGDAVRCVFHINNLLWMVNHNLITESNTIASDSDRDMLFGE